jgi:5-formyltetrahydrofolate cyclo-ligase
MTKQKHKKKFREACLKKLKKVTFLRSYSKDKQLQKQLYAYIRKNNAKEIMLYLPLKMEVNIYPVIMQLRRENKNLYVPFMEGASFRLVKYRLPLHKKQFGIKEPNDSKQYRKKKIDLSVVPIVGVDVTQRRVGFGKGMYDRFFEKNSKNIKEVVFLAREHCFTKEVVTDHYDVKADKIFTP